VPFWTPRSGTGFFPD
jgi:hypothetical protein